MQISINTTVSLAFMRDTDLFQKPYGESTVLNIYIRHWIQEC